MSALTSGDPLQVGRIRHPLQHGAHLPDVWVAMRSSLRTVLDETTLGHVLTGTLPPHVRRMAQEPDAWLSR